MIYRNIMKMRQIWGKVYSLDGGIVVVVVAANKQKSIVMDHNIIQNISARLNHVYLRQVIENETIRWYDTSATTKSPDGSKARPLGL